CLPRHRGCSSEQLLGHLDAHDLPAVTDDSRGKKGIDSAPGADVHDGLTGAQSHRLNRAGNAAERLDCRPGQRLKEVERITQREGVVHTDPPRMRSTRKQGNPCELALDRAPRAPLVQDWCLAAW